MISAEAKDLVKRLMCVDDKKRLSVAQLLEHPWVAKPDAASSDVLKRPWGTNFKRNRLKQRLKRGVRRMIHMNRLLHGWADELGISVLKARAIDRRNSQIENAKLQANQKALLAMSAETIAEDASDEGSDDMMTFDPSDAPTS